MNVNNRTYTVVNDLTTFYQVFITGSVTDELTEEPLTGRFTVLSDLMGIFIKVMEGGLFCIAGEVARVFPHIDTTSYIVDLRILAPGYKEATLSVAVPQNSNFALPAVQVNMRRLPVRIQGRVVGQASTVTPVSNALVRFVDEPHPPTPLTEHVVALRTPLHFAHESGVTVNSRPLAPKGNPKPLIASAPVGSQALVFADQAGIAINDVLRIGPDVWGEYAVVTALPKDSALPGLVALSNPLNHSFLAGTAVQPFALGAVEKATKLTRAAETGDGTLFLQGLLDSNTVEVADSTPAHVEYQALGAITDTEGYYRLDGMNRVRTVYMDVSATGFSPLVEPISWTIDYGQPINSVNFRLTP